MEESLWNELEKEWAQVSQPYRHTDLVALLHSAREKVRCYADAHEDDLPFLDQQMAECCRNQETPIFERPKLIPKLITSHSPQCVSSGGEAGLEEQLSQLYHSIVKVQAPMVRCSRPAFRKVCRAWGTDISYTHMIIADSFSRSARARHAEFALYQGEDRLVVQLAAKSGPTMARAAMLVAPYCDAIDLNCGCPQKWAIREGIGSSLLEKPDLVADMVQSVRNAVGDYSSRIPCVVKMRIKDDMRQSVDFARQCVAAGAGWLTVHGRTPSCTSSAPVQLEAIKLIQESVGVPIVANGGINSPLAAVYTALSTGASAVMAAEALLANPAAFYLPTTEENRIPRCSLTFSPTRLSVCEVASNLHKRTPESSVSSYEAHTHQLGRPISQFTLAGLPATPLETLSDFIRAAIATDLAPPTTIQQILRMARAYLTPSERVYISQLRSNISLIRSLEEMGLFIDRGHIDTCM